MKKINLIFFFIILTNFAYAEGKVVYLDVNYLLSESAVGKYVNSNLKKISDDNNEVYKNFEAELKSDEEKLLTQQNILKKEDYEKKISELRNKAGNKILKSINEIMTEYSKKNSISLVITKQSIIIGKTELDVTNDILELLNKKITKLELN